jgi:hypothetical protein
MNSFFTSEFEVSPRELYTEPVVQARGPIDMISAAMRHPLRRVPVTSCPLVAAMFLDVKATGLRPSQNRLGAERGKSRRTD